MDRVVRGGRAYQFLVEGRGVGGGLIIGIYGTCSKTTFDNPRVYFGTFSDLLTSLIAEMDAVHLKTCSGSLQYFSSSSLS